MIGNRNIFPFILLGLYISGISHLRAQDIVVPVELEIPLFSKILVFDRNMKNRIGHEMTVGILFQSHYRRSLTVKKDFLDYVRINPDQSVNQIPIRFVAVDLNDTTDLASVIEETHINVLYITPLRAVDMNVITLISRSKSLITWTGVPEYVAAGISIGIGIKGGKPLILINRPAAIAEGLDFSSQLLKLAQIFDNTTG
jgi:hypothetical protein